MIVSDLTPDVLAKAWQCYIKAANRHGQPPNFDKVQKALEEEGLFVARTGVEHWTTQFVIRRTPDGFDIEVQANPAITAPSHRRVLEHIVADFHNHLRENVTFI